MLYTASYDAMAKVISAVVVGMLAVAAAAVHSVLIGGLCLLLLGFAYAYSPRSYAISERTLVVRRLIGNVRVPLAGVREARPAAADDFHGCVRLWGNGGLFGYYGLFRTAKLGKCRWYVTNRSHTVILTTEDKTFVLSPDDVSGFLAAIHSAAPVSGMPHAPSQTLESHKSGSTGKAVGISITAVVFAVIAFALLYSPGPPPCTVTPDSLTIHDRFYPVTLHSADVDVEHIRVVDLDSEADWRPVARTNGFANAHYHSGWFRVAGGQKVRMYWTDSKRLCLLPPKAGGAPVLVEVRDPEEFARELRLAWTHPS